MANVENVTGDLAKSLKVLQECLNAMISKTELHKNSGRELDTTQSTATACYTDGVTDNNP